MNTNISYQSLNDKQKDLLRTKVIDAEQTPEEWLTFLQPIAAHDRTVDKALKGTYVPITVGAIVMIVGFFVTIAADMTVGIGALLTGAGLLAFGVMKSYRLKAVNIEGDLGKLVIPMLHILKEELPAKGILKLQLNLCELEQSELVEEIRPQKKKDYPRVTTTLFRNFWLRGTTRLADGTMLRLRITDLVKKIEKKKRNPRGRIKTKLKYKQQSVLSLAMGFRADVYTLRSIPPKVKGKVTVRSRNNRHWVKLRCRAKFPARLRTEPDSIALNRVVEAMATAFRHVLPVRNAQ